MTKLSEIKLSQIKELRNKINTLEEDDPILIVEAFDWLIFQVELFDKFLDKVRDND